MSGKRGGAGSRARAHQPGPERRQGGAARILVFGAVIFLLGIVVFGIFSRPSGQPVAAAPAPAPKADRIDVVYFHRTERCDSCQWAGQMSRKTVESYFGAELASGKVTFQEVDVQKPENRALALKFKASGSQLFLNFVSSGKDRIVEAQQTYPFIGYESRFSGALRTLISSGLGAG